MEFYNALNWRYAAKKMNGEAVPQEKVDRILDAIQLAPTSLGAQPFSVFVITDQDLKERILPIANGQTQIVDSSQLLVFAAWDEYTEKHADEFIQQTAKERGLELSDLTAFKNYLESLTKKSKEELFEWSAKQAYIALGFGLAAAAVEEVDATPMEGFDPSKLDALLDLRSKGMRSVLLMPLGYRDKQNDWLAPMKKVRRPKEQLFINSEVGELV
tara:strand:+ start:7834 stop:8478 length:645 start_codon:yes stop_codon:yes gene_type:complete